MNRTLAASVIAVCICLAETNVHAAGPRTAAPVPAPAAQPASQADDTDDADAAARARVVAKGKRMEISGGVVSIAGSLSTLAVVITDPTGRLPTTLPLIGVGLAVAFTGLGVAIAGARRRKHPEKFMRRTQLSAAPWGGRTGGGASIMLRF